MTAQNEGEPKMMSQQELEAIRERADKATPGPWFKSAFDTSVWCGIPGTNGKDGNTWEIFHIMPHNHINNGRFVEYARTDIPALLSHIEAQRREIERLTEQLGLQRVLEAADLGSISDDLDEEEWELEVLRRVEAQRKEDTQP